VTGVVQALTSLASASLRYLPTVAPLWLAVFFRRTLRAGEVPLIERVARIDKPSLTAVLCRYTRALTASWCVYFAAAITAALGGRGFGQASAAVTVLSALLFAGEHCIGRLIFPGASFPRLIQQVRDTAAVWRPKRGPQA
jgi:uncharacterized membrane protein